MGRKGVIRSAVIAMVILGAAAAVLTIFSGTVEGLSDSLGGPDLPDSDDTTDSVDAPGEGGNVDSGWSSTGEPPETTEKSEGHLLEAEADGEDLEGATLRILYYNQSLDAYEGVGGAFTECSTESCTVTAEDVRFDDAEVEINFYGGKAFSNVSAVVHGPDGNEWSSTETSVEVTDAGCSDIGGVCVQEGIACDSIGFSCPNSERPKCCR